LSETAGGVITTKKALDEVCSALVEAPYFAADVELTRGGKGTTDVYRGQMEGLAIAYRRDNVPYSWYAPFLYYPGAMSPAQVMPALYDAAIGVPEKTMAAHEMFFDARVLTVNGYAPKTRLFCTRIAAWMIRNIEEPRDLDSCAKRELGFGKLDTFAKVDQSGDLFNQRGIVEYARRDGLLHLLLYEKYLEKIEKMGMLNIWNLEMDVLPDVLEMSIRGVAVDVDYCELLRRKYQESLKTLETDIREVVGEPNLDVNSTQQIAGLIWDRLKLSPPKGAKEGKSGQMTTEIKFLERMLKQHPVLPVIVKYRHRSHYLEAYVNTLLSSMKHSPDGRVHPEFNQAVKSGRMSIKGPALQTLPKKGEGIAIRRAIVVMPGRKLVGGDFSQIELRLVAHVTQDPTLLGAYERGEDIHAITAAELKCPRDHAKAANFKLIYKVSAHGFAEQENLSDKTAEKYIAGFFKKYAMIPVWHKRVDRQVKEFGFTQTILGLRREFHIDRFDKMAASSDPDTARQGRSGMANLIRSATNHIIQGTAAQLCKIAMRNAHVYRFGGRTDHVEKTANEEQLKILHRFPVSLREESFPILQVHDEIVWEAPESAADEISAFLKVAMETALTIPRIPIVATMFIVDNYAKISADALEAISA